MEAETSLVDVNDVAKDLEVQHEETGKNYWAVILLVLCVFVVFGNVLVILSVARERLLQNMTNFFIVSLALADLLVAGFVMPFSVYVLVNWGMWGLPKVVCDFYIASDVICSTSSIFNLVAVSIDRYYAVTAPITYSQHKDKHGRVYAFIVFCWLASIAIGSPIMLGANHIPDDDNTSLSTTNSSQIFIDSNQTYYNVETTHHDVTRWNESEHDLTRSNATTTSQEFVCAFYNPDFIIYSSLGSFYIPCFVMIFLYGRIFKTLHQRAVKARRAKKKTFVPTKPQVKEQPIQPPLTQGPATTKLTLAVSATNGGATTTFLTETTPFTFQDQTTKAPPIIEKTQKIEIKIDVPHLDNCGTSCASSSPSQLPSSGESSDPTAASSPPPKPNMAHKACGPDTSLYERVKTTSARNGKEKPNGLEVKPTIVKAPLKESPSGGGNSLQLHPVVRCCDGGDITPVTSVPEVSTGDEVEKKNQFREFSENLFKLGQRVSRKGKNKKKKEKNAARKERKATKTLAIVLGCFLFCWTPFFTCNMINAICIKLESSWHPGDTAFLITTWLGYVNSCINPIIYTIFNPEFRKAFKKILGLGH